MEFGSYSIVWFIILALLTSLLLLWPRKKLGNLPPGPPTWPIVGNLFDLGTMPHRTLRDLRSKYGDVVWLKLGSKNTMVILSAKSATEFFKNHDLSFAERMVNETSRVHSYHEGSLALAPYGPYWRMLRKLVTVDMVVKKRILETTSVRRKCIDNMLLWIEKEGIKKDGVHVARFVFLMTFNLFGNLMMSRDLVDPQSNQGSEFFTRMMGLMEWSGYANMADFFPWLRWLDPQGLKKKMERDLGRVLRVASEYVKEHVKERREGKERRKDFLDILMEFEGNGKDEPAKISDRDINIFILEIFMAGSETTSSTTEWALTELLCNPDTMNTAKAELNQVVGPSQQMEESHLDNLPYLQAVVKETLRLHPPIPFLIPRKAITDTSFMGYQIPKDTQVFVNAYAIGRDSDVWTDPLQFKPERFLGSEVDYRGQHFEFIPFGAGRRMCAGVALGHQVLNLTLGSMLHHFDWELDSKVATRETMDMKERLGITMRKSQPLIAVAKKCVV